MKTLVIILSETIDSDLTFNNIKTNLVDELNADLCICTGVNIDYNNKFYKLAKYKFLYNKTCNFEDTLNFAFTEINKKKKKIFEKLQNINLLNNQNINIRHINKIYNSFIDFFFGINNSLILQEKLFDYYENITDEIVYKNNELYFIKNNSNLLNYTQTNRNASEDVMLFYGVQVKENTKDLEEGIILENNYNKDVKQSEPSDNNYPQENNIISYKKQIHLKKFLEINIDFKEVLDSLFDRWFLLQKLIKYNLIQNYDRFVITRGDYIYTLPHPKMEILDANYIWVPNGEYYNGIASKHAILSKNNIVEYLNILESMVLESNIYYMKMTNYSYWNLEQVIKFHLEQKKLLYTVKYFPYIMYIIRSSKDPHESYYSLYQKEYEISKYYKEEFDKLNLDINKFYIKKLKIINKELYNFSLLNFIYKKFFIL